MIRPDRPRDRSVRAIVALLILAALGWGTMFAARFMSRRAALVGTRAVEDSARHAYDGKTLLVPGIPEAVEDTDALDALRLWSHRLDDRLRRLLPAGSYKVEGIAA